MKLNLLERVTLMKVITPQEGNFMRLKLIRDMITRLGATNEEFKEYNIVEKDGMSSWDKEKGAIEKEIPIGEKETEIIVEVLRKMNDAGNLTQNHFSLYEKFVEKK